MTQKQKICLNALNIAFEGQSWKLKKLLKKDLYYIWKNPGKQAFVKLGFEEVTIEKAVKTLQKLDPEKEWKKLEKERIEIITIDEVGFPKLLKEIADPPTILYIKGKLPENENFNFAIVGTRGPSPYGRWAGHKIASELTSLGVNIVSGLAFGIDAIAHKAATDQKRPTFAVLGGGVDERTLYPQFHKALARKIIEHGGGIISEYPIGQVTYPYNFPQRNRIISGLSRGILVIEAKEKSGALITANWALQQNREVFALPGPINSLTSVGPNNLIKQGAKAVTITQDIIDELRWEIKTEMLKDENFSTEERIIVDLLKDKILHIDRIIESVKFPPEKILSLISQLEIKGKIKNMGGEVYALL